MIPFQLKRENIYKITFDPIHQKPYLLSNAGDRITERAVQYMLKKYHVNPKKLRHTFCQRLVDNNMDIETVSRLAGHRDINVTKKYVKSKMNKHKIEDAINGAFKMTK